MIPRCILTVTFVPTSTIVYRPSLGADNFRRRPGFRNEIRSPTLYLCLIMFRFSLLLEVAIIFVFIIFDSIPVCLESDVMNHISSKY
jgi:hypothetical protein